MRITRALPLVLVLASCATAPTIKDVEERTPESRIVFGSIKVYEDGKLQKWGMKFTGYSYFYVTILPDGEHQAITYRVDKDGIFFWDLAPGGYTLLGYHWEDKGAEKTGHIGARFIVDDAGEDAYIGSIEFRGNEFYLVPAFADLFADVAATYDAKFPNRAGKAVKRLLEEPKPIGQAAGFRGACHAEWEIECGDRYSGVTPLSPEVSTSGFPTTGTLSPNFRWEPSPKDGVAYDLILYEAAEYRVGDENVPSFMKGQVVAYQEGLNQPVWIPSEPLEPDTRYIWSVRLREGDIVSSWSTQRHFTFALVFMSSGYGGWFQFKTP